MASMKLVEVNGELEVLGQNAAMKLLLSESQREKLAEFIVSGNGKFYSRSEIKVRIQKIARRIALKSVVNPPEEGR